MSTTELSPHLSRVRLGIGRVDITPPVGIHHGLWGAAPPHAATGIHRPHYVDVLLFGSVEETKPQLAIAYLDLVGLSEPEHEAMRHALSDATQLPLSQTIITYSHTHATAFLSRDRVDMPGGELILPFLAELSEKVAAAGTQAASQMQEVLITYGTGRCNMANNRDYWDDANGIYACGLNPETQGDDTVLVARVTDANGTLVATIVNYGCHPTTLAWENTVNSPDYPGALRDTVEAVTGAPCLFALSPCGDLGPREGFVGDLAVADKNGRWLAYAALATLESMGPPATNFHYLGPVISGATLGAWGHQPMSADQMAAAALFSGGRHEVALPLKALPNRAELEADLTRWLAEKEQALAQNDAITARNAGAQAERTRRWLARVDNLPTGSTFPYHFSLYRFGNALWIFCSGEPYSQLQVEIRNRFPNLAVIISPLAGQQSVAYLLPKARYGQGLYQEEPSILAPGCLEKLIDAMLEQIEQEF